MTAQLSWDLHVHPGPSSVPRWGTGAEIQAAARRAGVKGFVWKSHERHTAKDCAALPSGAPRAIGSASLNAWATPESVSAALADGAFWIWGPTYRDGHVGWDTDLPKDWSAFAAILTTTARPLVLATGHLGAEGRRAFAELASTSPLLLCSITHALYVNPDEVSMLVKLGCVFEVDLYTGTRDIAGRPRVEFAAGNRAVRDRGASVYLTTDCGQLAVGDPYLFSREVLATLGSQIGDALVAEIAVANPERVAAHALETVS